MKESILKAFQLKSIERAGWLRVGIENPESVAAHSWGLGLLALILCPEGLNLASVLGMALVHDLPEVITGDITPHDEVSIEEKERLERSAAKSMLSDGLYKLWLEYQENISPESQFVHQLDKLDMGLQAQLYSDLADTSEFTESALAQLEKKYQVLLK